MRGDRLPPCLELQNLSRAFGGLKAVDSVSLSVQPGERRALIGPNGAGKTTLFNLISGEIRPTEGAIAFRGSDVTALAPHQRAARGIARTFQITRLFASLTVLENMLLACVALDRAQVHAAPAALRVQRPDRTRHRPARGVRRSGLRGRRPPATCPTATSACSRSRCRWPAGRRSCCSTNRWPASRQPNGRSMLRHLDRLDRAIAVLHDRARHGRRVRVRRDRHRPRPGPRPLRRIERRGQRERRGAADLPRRAGSMTLQATHAPAGRRAHVLRRQPRVCRG